MSEPKFKPGQRVKVLPGIHFPPTKQKDGIRYGWVLYHTSHAGMNIVAEDRQNAEGEWAYAIEFTKGAGACWFTEKHLRPLREKKERAKSVFDTAVDAMSAALKDLEAHQGQEGYRHDCDKGVHLYCALKQAGLKVIRDRKFKPAS